ncbi:hypothetical protein [Microbacterium hominis]|uniref:Nuclear transport factor 2 family protein n=1 Tax=Microbacterium hominis TaxID=162426 RepID=A0A7D4QH93_9MICO|nr:hypothetical protein [Microbacterium hominis]QKJ18756.1 hypothetical protein HQM25_04725 [Microbacterium hominis]
MSEQTKRSRALIIGILVAIVAVVVVAIVAVFAGGDPAQRDPATPEGVVQRYAQAVIDGDIDGARSYLVEDAADPCDRVEPIDGAVRVTLIDTVERDDSARVSVRITSGFGSGPLGTSEFESDGVFDLDRSGDGWLIATTPWELTVCAGTGPF